MRILLTGGGTGGHVYPALSVIDSCQADPTTPPSLFHWVGSTAGMERSIVEKAGVSFSAVSAGAIRGRSPIAAIRSALSIAQGMTQAHHLIREFKPDAVLATGGFVCVPVVLAARFAGVPSLVYLPDLRPGWAVRFLARVATAVSVSFDEVVRFIPAKRVVVTGYPVRSDLQRVTKTEGRAKLGLPTDEPVVLVVGGSRGARTINDAVIRDAPRILKHARIVHSTGTQGYSAIRESIDRLPEAVRDRYRVSPYLDAELAPAMAAADVIVSRSGASCLGEFPAVGAPSIVVPYPHAGGHQQLNADFLSRHGAASVVDDASVQQGALSDAIESLLNDPDRLNQMSASARRLARPHAARDIFELLKSLASERYPVETSQRAVES